MFYINVNQFFENSSERTYTCTVMKYFNHIDIIWYDRLLLSKSVSGILLSLFGIANNHEHGRSKTKFRLS